MSDALEIAELRVFPVREPVSGRGYSIVRVKTNSGVTGFGECAAVSASQLDAARQFWTGRSATTYAHAQADSPLAGAVDMALLDIVGKACGAPVYRVLGGPTRNKARVFASVGGAVPENTVGHRVFGVRAPRPAARNQGQAYELAVRRLAEGLRSRGHEFIFEGGEMLTPGDAGKVAATIQPLHPLWFDEPCAVSNLQTLRKIADECVVPLGFGREIRAAGVYQDLLREGLIDVARPGLTHFGITGSRRIAALAETYYVAVAPRHDGGPIATAAALHLAASLPNFYIQQLPFTAVEADRAMRSELAGSAIETVKDGFASLPTGPGLGIAVSEAALEKYHAA
jgi:galactonate dehydratase